MQHFSGQKKLICPPGEHRAGREIYRMENSVSSAALNAAREQLHAAEAAREVILLQHIANGVVIDSRTVQIAPDVVIAPGAVILAGTVLRGRTVIGAGCIIGPIPLPTDREIVTVLRATHKYKDSREQFESRTHKRLIDILKPSNKTVEALMSLQLPAGVDIEIKL